MKKSEGRAIDILLVEDSPILDVVRSIEQFWLGAATRPPAPATD